MYVEILNKDAPLKVIKVKRRPKPWFTDCVKDAILQHDKLHKLTISKNDAHHWSNYRKGKERVKNLVKSAKGEFFKKLIEHKNNRKKIWTTIRIPPKKKTQNNLPTHRPKNTGR